MLTYYGVGRIVQLEGKKTKENNCVATGQWHQLDIMGVPHVVAAHIVPKSFGVRL